MLGILNRMIVGAVGNRLIDCESGSPGVNEHDGSPAKVRGVMKILRSLLQFDPNLF